MRKSLTPSTMALLIGLGLASLAPAVVRAQPAIGISVSFAPPPLPLYEQPPIPGYGYFWTPGYWAWDGSINDYFWVPGTWVQPPRIGYLWTPAYWGWANGRYLFNDGYWGPRVGFYGGVNYGFGYGGNGYEGGYWRGNRLYYNRSVNNLARARITTVYTKVVTRSTAVRISYVGGVGGLRTRPDSQQLAVMRAAHVGPTPIQIQHREMADKEPTLRAGVNHGAPPVAATPIPGHFKGADIVPAGKPPATHGPSTAPTAKKPIARTPGGTYGASPHAPTPADRVRPAGQPRQRTSPQPVQPPRHQGQQAMPDQRLNQPQQRPAPQAQPQRQPAPQQRQQQQQQQDHQRPQPGPQQRSAPDRQQNPSGKQDGNSGPGLKV